jgi:hypothetical protein
MKGLNELLALYAFSLGLILLVFSILGSIAGFVICFSLNTRPTDKATVESPSGLAEVSVLRSLLVYSAATFTSAVMIRFLYFGTVGSGWCRTLAMTWISGTS